MSHLGMDPRLTEVGEKEQNGSVEASNGALKRQMEQELLLRGGRDFESEAAYVTWLEGVLRKRNRARSTRLAKELAVMRPLSARRLPSYKVLNVRVGSGSTLRAKSHTYSVPPRLIGEKVRVHVYETRVEVWLGGRLEITLERVRGRGTYNVNWRHMVGWMVKKPGAFRRYHYRDALFPTPTFRTAWERLDASLATWSADMNYLQVLKLAREAGLAQVEAEVRALLDAGILPRLDDVKERMEREPVSMPAMAAPEVDLGGYDELTPEARKEAGR